MAKKFKFTDGKDKWEGTGDADKVNALGGNDKLDGKGGDDKIKGGDGNDTIKGGSGDDKINGQAGNDKIDAGSGDDKITATSGDDTVNGGTGEDTIVLAGNYDVNNITKNADGSYTIVTSGGTVTVSGVEHFQFADGVVDEADLLPPEGIEVDLTTGTDTFTAFTEGADTITGAAGTLNATDIIIDNNAGDGDVMNLTLTAANGAAKVSGIETINVDWDAFGTATFDATNVTGATINVSSDKVGYLGAVQINGAGANTVTAGTGAVGALTVAGATAVVVNATNSSTVSVGSTGVAANDKSATITAGASTTTVTTTGGFQTNNVTGGAATTAVTVAGTTNTTDVANITLAASGTVSQSAVENVNITAAGGTTVTLGSNLAALTTGTNSIKSSGAVTLVATTTQLDDFTLTDATTGLTVNLTSAGAADLSKIAADTFNLQNGLAGDLTLASGSTVLAGVDIAANKFVGTSATGESLNVTASVDQTVIAVDTTVGTEVETLNITAALAAADANQILSIGTVTGNAVTLAGASKVSISSLVADSFDASAATGDLEILSVDANTAAVVGSATAKNTVTFAANAVDASYTGGNGIDIVVAANTTTDFSAVLGEGANTFTSTGLTSGSVTVLGGSGVDTISVASAAAGGGTIVIQSAGGADAVTVTLDAGDEVVNANLGDGNDTFTFGGDTSANDSVTVDAGAGTDVLDLNGADLTAFTTLALTNFEVIDDSDGTATVLGSLLTGKTYEIRGVGAGSTLDVELATAGTYNFSTLVLNNTISDANVGLAITGSTGADTIVATSGSDTISTNGGNDTITAGQGADSITLGAGNDTVVFASGDAGVTSTTIDFLDDFKTAGTDVLKLGTAGSATNYTEVDIASASATDYAQALAAANTALNGTVMYAVVENSLDTGTGWDGTADAMLFVDFDLDGTADFGVQLTGKLGADIAFSDIIA